MLLKIPSWTAATPSFTWPEIPIRLRRGHASILMGQFFATMLLDSAIAIGVVAGTLVQPHVVPRLVIRFPTGTLGNFH